MPSRSFCPHRVSVLLGVVLGNTPGMEADTYAEGDVFGPPGITDHERMRRPDGSIETDGGLAPRPRDLAKIGRLFPDEGGWR